MRKACDEVKQDAEMFASRGGGYRPKNRRRAAADSTGTHNPRGEYQSCSAGIFQGFSKVKSVGGFNACVGNDNSSKDTGQESCGLQASANA